MSVLLASLIAQRPNVEKEIAYINLVFTVDGLQHPLLQGIPCESDDSGLFTMTSAMFIEQRILILKRERAFVRWDV